MREGFQHYASEEPERKLPFSNQLMLSPLISHRLRQVRTDMRTLLHGNNSKPDLLFDLFPYAYVTGRAANLWEEMLWFLAGIVLESFTHIPAFESSGSGLVHNQLSQHGKHVIV